MTSILQNIFSVRNDERKIHKIITIAGVKIKFKRNILANLRDNITFIFDKHNPLYKARIDDGFLRLILTHKCNAKCDFCPHWRWSKEKLSQELSKDFIYEKCKPLYKKVKMLSLCGGEITIYKDCIDYLKYINENYPHITIVTESNGINWNKKWQQCAMEGLYSVNFSVNGSNEIIYHNSCWKEDDYEIPYNKTHENILSYIKLLKENNLSSFNPNISMVINKGSSTDVYNFVKFALTIKAKKVNFYFDNQENKLFNRQNVAQTFKYPELAIPALKTLMEMERVLAKKFCIYFRLFLPASCVDETQAEVEKIPIDELRNKYKELLELAKDRDMLKEHNERNKIRKEKGKKTLSFDEDFNPTLRLINVANKRVCFSPWGMVDIMANGKLSFCSWTRHAVYELKYIYDKKGNIDWIKTINSKPFIIYRKKHFNGDFSGCMPICPMNSSANPLFPIHSYGYDRVTE